MVSALSDPVLGWWVMVGALVVAGLAVAVLGLAEAANIPPVLSLLTLFHATQTYAGDVLRVSSSLEYATIAAMVLEMLIPLMVAWVVVAERAWVRLSLLASTLMSVLALILTLTPSALLGLAVALCVIIGISLAHRPRLNALAAAGTLTVTIAIGGGFVPF